MSKKSQSEADICRNYITPAIADVAGWDSKTQIRQEVYFTSGRIIISDDGKQRIEGKKADYILYYKNNLPLAIVEAKDNNHTVRAGIQQALRYGEILDIPFIYSSNGDAFVEHDRTGKSKKVEREISLEKFPKPEELWERYKVWKGITPQQEPIITKEFYAGLKKPRFYQEVAINRVVEATLKGQNRILLVMATGTGKTYVASQIIYKLWKSKVKKRILFLADRNILVDQAKNNDFKHFGGAMTKVTNRSADKSYEVYLALYQAVSGADESRDIYKQFSKDFFDLIIVDECHRGSADENSAWREILEYFESATQIGMTATPKETEDISNIDYFGEPVYVYSLKQGIEDGFLAPYRVIRITLDCDRDGYKPEPGKLDKYGKKLPDKKYTVSDYDRTLAIDERTELVAKKITEFLKKTDRFAKAIVFCVDIDHAERMSEALRNENGDLVTQNSKYVVKITGDDDYGKMELDNFIDPSTKYPVIATTSKLLTTGVDAQTCKLIVLDSNIKSMTDFKQIIGRGTRVREDYDKRYFTIMDFRQVTKLFADPNFDGDPVQCAEFGEKDDIIIDNPPQSCKVGGQEQVHIGGGEDTPGKYYVNNVPVNVVKEQVQLFDADGKPIKCSLKDYTKKIAKSEYKSLDDFLQKWHKADRKTTIINEMIERGIFLSELRKSIGKEYDDFDLICHVAFGQKLQTRKERANRVRNSKYFEKYGKKAMIIIDALLDKYVDEGIENIESINILKVNPFIQFGTLIEIIRTFGGRGEYLNALHEIENQLYLGK